MLSRPSATVDGRNPATKLNHTKPFFVGIYRGIVIPGFLRWCRCEMDFVHPQYWCYKGSQRGSTGCLKVAAPTTALIHAFPDLQPQTDFGVSVGCSFGRRKEHISPVEEDSRFLLASPFAGARAVQVVHFRLARANHAASPLTRGSSGANLVGIESTCFRVASGQGCGIGLVFFRRFWLYHRSGHFPQPCFGSNRGVSK